jgi:colanic acid/amylovoran biosynthesis glycosyltransferase
MTIAYLVSRFPVATETFILREMTAVQRELGAPVEVLSLFAPRTPFAHPGAQAFLGRARRPGAGAALGGLAWALARHPRTLLAVLVAVVTAYARRPARLAKALVTVVLGTAHARWAQRTGVDHVHAHWANLPALAAWVTWRLTGIPYSITPHAHDIFIDQTNLRRLIDDAAFVVAISEYNREFLRRHSAGSTPLPVVRYGIDLERFAYAPRPLPAEGPVRALCVASLAEQKGHRVLFEALAIAGEVLDRIELRLVGAGPLRADLEALARELGLAGRISFLGTLDEDAVAAELAAADLAVLPSIVAPNGRQEGLPNVLLEALATGTPAVGTALSGCPELLREEATCLLAMPGDPYSLAAALEHVLRDPDAAARRAAAGRALVEREFALERSGRLMAELLTEAPA